MGSLISIEGIISHTIRHTEEGLGRFSVDTEAGRFYIQARWDSQLDRIQPDESVHVIGRLHSFTFHRCRCQHVYIEPLVIIQGIDRGEGSARGRVSNAP